MDPDSKTSTDAFNVAEPKFVERLEKHRCLDAPCHIKAVEEGGGGQTCELDVKSLSWCSKGTAGARARAAQKKSPSDALAASTSGFSELFSGIFGAICCTAGRRRPAGQQSLRTSRNNALPAPERTLSEYANSALRLRRAFQINSRYSRCGKASLCCVTVLTGITGHEKASL